MPQKEKHEDHDHGHDHDNDHGHGGGAPVVNVVSNYPGIPNSYLTTDLGIEYPLNILGIGVYPVIVSGNVVSITLNGETAPVGDNCKLHDGTMCVVWGSPTLVEVMPYGEIP